MSLLILWIITSLFFAIGLLGTFIPTIPGLGLIILGVLFYAIVTKFAAISITTTIVLCLIALIGFVASHLTGALGAKVSGGGRYAALGTLVGAILGLVGGPPGVVVGAIVGAFLGALYESQSLEKALRITVASLIGLISGALVQFVVGAGIILTFLGVVLF